MIQNSKEPDKQNNPIENHVSPMIGNIISTFKTVHYNERNSECKTETGEHRIEDQGDPRKVIPPIVPHKRLNSNKRVSIATAVPEMVTEEEGEREEPKSVPEKSMMGKTCLRADWDSFVTLPATDEDPTEKDRWVEPAIRLLKILAYMFTFVVLLFGSVLSRSIVLLMTSKVSVDSLEKEFNQTRSETESSSSRISWLWCLYFATITPYFFAFLTSARVCLFKTYKKSSWSTFLVVFVGESAHCVGLCMLLFMVLPEWNSWNAVLMMNCVGLVPSLLPLLVHSSGSWLGTSKWKREVAKHVPFISIILVQLVSIVAWSTWKPKNFSCLILIALILVSFKWWENFVTPNSMIRGFHWLETAQNDLNGSRYFVQLFIAPWKVLLVFVLMLLGEHLANAGEKTQVVQLMFGKFSWESEALWFLLAHIVLNHAIYVCAKFVCKVGMQKFSFSMSLYLAVPTTLLMWWLEIGKSILSKEYYWKIENDFFGEPWLCVMTVLSLIAPLATAWHVWTSDGHHLASTQQLFVSPMYEGTFIDISLLFNRRRVKLDTNLNNGDEKEEVENIITNDLEANTNMNYSYLDEVSLSANSIAGTNQYFEPRQTSNAWTSNWEQVCDRLGLEEDSIDAKPEQLQSNIIRVFVCVTMWHEDRNEMLHLLKTVMRLDYEQGIRRIAREHFGDNLKKNIFDMEIAIFIDDAFESKETPRGEMRVINRFVEQLIDTINEAANQVVGKKIKVSTPSVIPTPYGGRLIWRLPMGSRLVAHLKDKHLIRHRKRWSQCMYMYYLLGHRLASRKDIDKTRRKLIMNNTFILTLDGDIKFHPEALDLALDLMRKNPLLGAACGRIHPIGSGPIQWYQKFEYAIGHWMQKATEHVFGCVLCSPGCFSLLRARALMDKSVMHRYISQSTEAMHHVQYDQGEDRWLCTLLLQRGWKIEYCAASDSYTHVPEGFAEIFGQRLRWITSTWANLFDLLRNYRCVVRDNHNISRLYIFYQFALLLGTIISPGAIFIVIDKAMETTLGTNALVSLLLNLVLIFSFSLVCYFARDNHVKIRLAFVFSAIYALLMLFVLVSIVLQPFSIYSLYFYLMIGNFILAAILHPQELGCLLCLPVYMLFIPSMYLLLPIYTVTNMHVLTWGTREITPGSTHTGDLQDAKTSLQDWFNWAKKGTNRGLITCSCFTTRAEDTSLIVEISSQVKHMQHLMNNYITQAMRRNSILQSETTGDKEIQIDSSQDCQVDVKEDKPESGTSLTLEDESGRPRWVTNHSSLSQLPVKSLHSREERFWLDLISKYLYPLKEDAPKKEQLERELKELRNKAVFAFGFINVIFVLVAFLSNAFFGISDSSNNSTSVKPDKEFNVDPSSTSSTFIDSNYGDFVGIFLIGFFGVILVLQVFGMLMHRLSTMTHLLATTTILPNKHLNFDASQFVRSVLRKSQRAKSSKKSSLESPTHSVDYAYSNAIFQREMQAMECTDPTKLRRMSKVLGGADTLQAVNLAKRWSVSKQLDLRRSTVANETFRAHRRHTHFEISRDDSNL